MLIISNARRLDYFTLTDSEKLGLIETIDKAKEIIEKEYTPDGYNIGINCGKDAGQSIMHFHCHIIPRYRGDIDNPRGGIRGVIPSKMNY
ncbi:MAG: HIT family protein [Oceanospirillaceae bacterium]|nr:HIT family protein [Oceanospirillaceae bacterium]